MIFVLAGVVERWRAGREQALSLVAVDASDPGASSTDRPAITAIEGGPATRAATLERIRQAAGTTYLTETLAINDSALHRWPTSTGRPLRVATVIAPASGAGGECLRAVGWAVSQWNDVGLPRRLEMGADSTRADIVIVWVDTLQRDGAGRADVGWNGRGEIVRATILLSVRFAGGTALSSAQRLALTLHELGHALGLGHSLDSADALHPTTAATELTTRDRRTAALLYELPTGNLKD